MALLSSVHEPLVLVAWSNRPSHTLEGQQSHTFVDWSHTWLVLLHDMDFCLSRTADVGRVEVGTFAEVVQRASA